ncbi:NHL repeat-containing protein [Stieleria maiorica]|nr:hypothetical protein [Stieleria maiorica]
MSKQRVGLKRSRRSGRGDCQARNSRRRLFIEPLEARCLLAVDVLYVGDQGDNSIQVFDAGTGAYVSTLVQSGASGLKGPRGMVIQGSNLLVVNQNVNTEFNGEVLRFNKDSGVASSPLVPSNHANAPFAPRGLVVKDNVAYVADFFAAPSRIAKYNATTGAFIGSLIPNGFAAEFNPRGLVFGPDNKLYVTVYSAFDSDILSEDASGYVLRFNDTSSGAFEVIARNTPDGVHQSGELHNPEGIVFDPSGTSLYVTSFRPDRSGNGVVVIDVATKTQREFIPLGGDNAAQSLLFGPDGRLYVPINTGAAAGSVRAYDVTTESFNAIVPTTSGRLQSPWYLTFGKTNPATLAYESGTTVDAAPVLAGVESTPMDYPIRSAAKVVSQTLNVADVDSTVLTGATIRIANNYQSGSDALSLGGPPVLQSNWNPATGTLTLSGTATLAKYQGALRCILFENTSSNPSTGQRRVVFQVSNGSVTSNQVSRDIRIVAASATLASGQAFSPSVPALTPTLPPPPSQGVTTVASATSLTGTPVGAEAESDFLRSQATVPDSNTVDRVPIDEDRAVQQANFKRIVADATGNPFLSPFLIDESLRSLYGDSQSEEPLIQIPRDESVKLLADTLVLAP